MTLSLALFVAAALPSCLAWNTAAIDTLYLNSSQLALSFVANGTGTNGGIYQAPVGLSLTSATYGTYDYCYMPHPRTTEYELPAAITSGQVKGQLVFLEYLQRHHKRTCYNILPGGENQYYNCSNVQIFEYANTVGGKPAHVYAETYSSPTNPFYVDYVNGTCVYPQITEGGVLDAIQHGQDLWGVYGKTLGLYPSSPDDPSIFFRTSSSELTEATSGGVIRGLYPGFKGIVPIHQQSQDTINEGYPCSAIGSLQSYYEQYPLWQEHLQAAGPLLSQLNPMLGTTNNSAWTSTFDHFNDNFQARQCNGYNLPCNIQNTSWCVSQTQANEVYRLGDWEWDFYWVAQPNKTEYITVVEGLFIGEILAHFEQATSGTSSLKVSHTFAHDGDVGPVLGALGIQSLRWPAMGSNIAMELWQTNNATNPYYVRVLYCGAPLRTATGDLSWIPYSQFKSILSTYVPSNIVSLCNTL